MTFVKAQDGILYELSKKEMKVFEILGKHVEHAANTKIVHPPEPKEYYLACLDCVENLAKLVK